MANRKAIPHLIRTEEALRDAVAHVSRYDNFVVDVETNSLEHPINDVVWVGLGAPDRSFIVPMGHQLGPVIEKARIEKRLPPIEERRILLNGQRSQLKRDYRIPAVYGDPGEQLRPDIAFDILAPLFTSDRLKIGANVKFDALSMQKYVADPIIGPFADTNVLVHILDENLLVYGLKEITVDHFLCIPVQSKEKRKKAYPHLAKGGIMDKPMDAVAYYLAKDVWYSRLLYDFFIRRVRRQPTLLETWEIEMQVYPGVIDMEAFGVRIDKASFDARGVTLAEEIAEIERKVHNLCGEHFALTDLNKKREYLFGKGPRQQGLEVRTKTKKTGVAQVNQAVLEYYVDTEYNELAELFLNWSKKDKLNRTFIIGLNKQLINGRLHTGYKQHGTVTGRFTSAGPNLQQIPRGDDMKDGFIADPGTVLVVADYSQIELRCAGFLAQDPEMIRVFIEGLDIHREAAASMLDIDPEEVSELQRQVGKTQNFGTLYGASEAKIAVVAGSSEKRARQFIKRYYQRFNRLEPWKQEVLAAARETTEPGSGIAPWVEIPPFGRRRRLPQLYSSRSWEVARAERQAVNAVVQGYAANIMKLAMIELHSNIAGTNIHLMLNVHDELVVQAPADEAEYAKTILVKSMEGVQWHGQPVLGTIPLTVDVGVGKSWKEGK